MDADRFDQLARLWHAPGSRRRLIQNLLGLGLGARVSALAAEPSAAKSCPPCRKKKRGKCKKKKPNGTPCPGGACLKGRCQPTTCSGGVDVCANCGPPNCICTRLAADPQTAICVNSLACDQASIGCENDAQCGAPSSESCIIGADCGVGSTICCPRCAG